METSLLVDFYFFLVLLYYFFSFFGICIFCPPWQLLPDKSLLQGSTLRCQQRRSCSPCFASLGKTPNSPSKFFLAAFRDFSFHTVFFQAASFSRFGFFQETRDTPLRPENEESRQVSPRAARASAVVGSCSIALLRTLGQLSLSQWKASRADNS